MVRYTPTGMLDTGFGSGGRADLPDLVYLSVAEHDGAYYALTYRTEPDTPAPIVIKVTASGAIDTSFGTDGQATGVPSACGHQPRDIAFAAGFVYLAASVPDVFPSACGAPYPVEINRFTSAGDLDPEYGESGRLLVDELDGLTIQQGGLTGVGLDGRLLLTVQTLPEGGRPAVTGVVGLRGTREVAGTFVPVRPRRVLDTRVGVGAEAGAVTAKGTLDLSLAGDRRSGVPEAGAGAVVLNLTVADPTADGFVAVYPTGSPPPLSGNLPVHAGRTIANLVTVPLGAGGAVSVRNDSAGPAQLVVEVVGYYVDGTAIEPGSFSPLGPARLLDTRDGTGAAAGPVPAAGVLDLAVAGRGGVPPEGAAAVVLSVTVTEPVANGSITVYPTGSTAPLTSSLSFTAGQSISGLVTSRLGAGGAVSVRNGSASAEHLVADIVGYYVAGTPAASGAFVALDPARVLDTHPVPAFGRFDLGLVGVGGVPTADVGAVMMSVTVTGSASSGFISVNPRGGPPARVANLSFTTGQTVANVVIVPVSVRGEVSFSNASAGDANLVVDVVGYFLASPDNGLAASGDQQNLPGRAA
jgi:hypothetical protein